MLNILESTFDEIREAVLDKDYFLIKRIKHGDEDAMETFVRQYYGMILKYCAYRIMRKDEAESITQGDFCKIFFCGVRISAQRQSAEFSLYDS